MPEKPFVSYAQHGEDVILWRAFGGRTDGTYVDAGAYDPTADSVTRALYERGWHGVNLEPGPGRLAAFEDARPRDINLAVAVGDEDGTATLTVPDLPGWSSLLPEERTGVDPTTSQHVEVPVRRLDTLLAELGIDHVDVLKIDVEGNEAAVVRGLLGGQLRPTVCVVEGVAPGVGRTAGDEAVAMLVEAGYEHCLFDGLNHYLTLDEALVPALSIPASPIDEYMPYGVQQLLDERAELHAHIATLAAQIEGRTPRPRTARQGCPTSRTAPRRIPGRTRPTTFPSRRPRRLTPRTAPHPRS
ncbi:FkbM family methyltransferase [Cellulomonas soli]